MLPIPRETVVESLLDAFAAVADEIPLALVLEDLHWAPAATIEMAHRLARRAAGARLLLLATARESAGPPDTRTALRDLTESGAAADLWLGPLDATDVEDLVSSIARLPDGGAGQTLARRVYVRSTGIPFYVLEVLKSLYDAGALHVRDGAWIIGASLQDPSQPLPVPESSGAILEGRLDLLGETPFAVFTAFAVWGRQSAVADIVRITGYEEEAVVTALAALERRRLLGRLDGLPVVAHEELAAVALRKAPLALVQSLHARAAQLAEERARQGQGHLWAVAARHAAAAGDVALAATAAARATSLLTQSSGRAAAQEALSRLLGDMPPAVALQVEAALQISSGPGTPPSLAAPNRHPARSAGSRTD